MSRFIFATVPLPGHTLPALAIVRALVDRHSVRWYSGAAFAEQVTATGATYVAISDYDYSLNGLDALYPDRRQHPGLRQLQSTWSPDSPNLFPPTSAISRRC